MKVLTAILPDGTKATRKTEHDYKFVVAVKGRWEHTGKYTDKGASIYDIVDADKWFDLTWNRRQELSEKAIETHKGYDLSWKNNAKAREYKIVPVQAERVIDEKKTFYYYTVTDPEGEVHEYKGKVKLSVFLYCKPLGKIGNCTYGKYYKHFTSMKPAEKEMKRVIESYKYLQEHYNFKIDESYFQFLPMTLVKVEVK